MGRNFQAVRAQGSPPCFPPALATPLCPPSLGQAPGIPWGRSPVQQRAGGLRPLPSGASLAHGDRAGRCEPGGPGAGRTVGERPGGRYRERGGGNGSGRARRRPHRQRADPGRAAARSCERRNGRRGERGRGACPAPGLRRRDGSGGAHREPREEAGAGRGSPGVREPRGTRTVRAGNPGVRGVHRETPGWRGCAGRPGERERRLGGTGAVHREPPGGRDREPGALGSGRVGGYGLATGSPRGVGAPWGACRAPGSRSRAPCCSRSSQRHRAVGARC